MPWGDAERPALVLPEDTALEPIWFDIRTYMRARHDGGAFRPLWKAGDVTPNDPVYVDFVDFQEASQAALLWRLHDELQWPDWSAHLPWAGWEEYRAEDALLSCNNYRGYRSELLESCDLGMAELPLDAQYQLERADGTTATGLIGTRPEYLVHRLARTRALGHGQIFTVPIPGDAVSPPAATPPTPVPTRCGPNASQRGPARTPGRTSCSRSSPPPGRPRRPRRTKATPPLIETPTAMC